MGRASGRLEAKARLKSRRVRIAPRPYLASRLGSILGARAISDKTQRHRARLVTRGQ